MRAVFREVLFFPFSEITAFDPYALISVIIIRVALRIQTGIIMPKGKSRTPHNEEHTPNPSQEGSRRPNSPLKRGVEGQTPLLRGVGGVSSSVYRLA